jgi:hypothetical protein
MTALSLLGSASYYARSGSHVRACTHAACCGVGCMCMLGQCVCSGTPRQRTYYTVCELRVLAACVCRERAGASGSVCFAWASGRG